MIRLPEEFEAIIRPQVGPGLAAFIRALDAAAPVSIRVNPRKLLPLPDGEQPVPWCPAGKYLRERPVFTLDPLFHAGAYYVQEASSMFLEQALRQTVDLDRPVNVLDLSAAPGGKSTHILSLISNDSLLIANEVIRSRASILAENIIKWGSPNAVVTSNDPAAFAMLPGFFDVVVVDAPCSGEGLFRKDAGALREWSPQHVAHCASRQKRILADIWPALREDGVLIYSTCTYNTIENEENLHWLDEQYRPEFAPLRVNDSWGIEEVTDGRIIAYRFYPHKVRGEGFFIAVMRKRGHTPPIRTKIKAAWPRPSTKVADAASKWLANPDGVWLRQQNSLLSFTPAARSREMNYVAEHFHTLVAGTDLASIKHDRMIPAHSFAMSSEINRGAFASFGLNREQALKYLRKEALPLEGAPTGHCLVTFESLPLGWVNNLGSRVNNLYPSEWRIRMAV